MAATTEVVSSYPASCLGELITKHLAENNLKVYKTEEIEDLMKTRVELTNQNVEAVNRISEKDEALDKVNDVNLKLQKQLKMQNQWLIRRWTQAVISGEEGQLDEGGFNFEDEIVDKNMTELMKSLQTRVINNNREKLKEIQALQEDKKIILQNQSKLLAVIREIAEFSEYPDPDRFQDHEERRMVSQSQLTNFVDHLKKQMDDNRGQSHSPDLLTSSSSAALEKLKRLDGKERQETLNDVNLLIEENDKLLGAQVNLVNFVQNIASFSGYLKKFENFSVNAFEKGDLDKLYYHIENMSKRSPSKIVRKRLSFNQDVTCLVPAAVITPPNVTLPQGQSQEPIVPLPQSNSPKAKSPTPPRPPVEVQQAPPPKSSSPPPVDQPSLPSPPKRARRNLVIIAEEKTDEQSVQLEDSNDDDPGEGDEMVEAWFACEPCKLDFEFVEDLKDHHLIFHEMENSQLVSYYNNDPRPSTSSSGQSKLRSCGFRKLPGCSVGRRVVVIAEEEKGVKSTKPLKDPASNKRKSAKISAPSRMSSRRGKRKILSNENAEYYYYSNSKKK